MAQFIPVSITTSKHKDNINQRRRQLFPSIDNDMDDLSFVKPLKDMSPPDSPSSLKSSDCRLYKSNFIQNNFSDYVILENIKEADNDKLLESKSFEENDDSMIPPLYFSLDQTVIQPSCSEVTQDMFKSSIISDTPSHRPSIQNIKTPQDSSTFKMNVPKLICKSPFNNFSNNLDNGKRKISPTKSPPVKKPKIDQNSKVRTALFSTSDLSIPSVSFYSKSDSINSEPSIMSEDIKTNNKTLKKSTPVYIKKINKRFGLINAGVQHKIRKPKIKQFHKEELIKKATYILNNSILNNYFKEITSYSLVSKQPTENQPFHDDFLFDNCQKQSNNSLIEVEDDPSPDPSKKFFKFKPSSAIVTVEKHIKLKVDKGKMCLVEQNHVPKRQKVQDTLKLDPADLMELRNENLIEPIEINKILNDLDDLEKENNPLPNKILLQAHNSVTLSENSIHLHLSPNDCNKNEKSQLNCLLSPTSQMCNMTSDLVLSSPKKAKTNINNILNNQCIEEISSEKNNEEKLFPIFYSSKNTQSRDLKPSKIIVAKKFKPLPKDQMLLDAGQKNFGMTQCFQCKFVYHMGDPNDELIHSNYHNAESLLQFGGWKNEHVVSNFLNARIIKIVPSDPKSWLRKVNDLLEFINRDFGYYDIPSCVNNAQVYIYIKARTICGCLVAEPRNLAYKMFTDNEGIDLCSEKSYPVKCGITRIWVSQNNRKEGIGTSLMDCLRANFIYGCILKKGDLAISSPTEDGKAFALKYFNTPNFMVY